MMHIIYGALATIFLAVGLLMLSYSKFKILGVTFKKEHAYAPETKKILRVSRISIVVACVAFFAISFLDLPEVYAFLLLFVFLVLIFLITGIAQKRLVALKQEKNWIYQSQTTAVTDTAVAREKGLAAPPKWVTWAIWLPCFLPLLLLPFVETEELLPWYILLLINLTLIVLPITYPAAVQTRATARSLDRAENQAYARKIERIQGISYLLMEGICVLFITILSLIMIFFPAQSSALFITIGLMIVALLILIIWSQKKLKEADKHSFGQSQVLLQEESHYKWGFYNNPNDRRLFVPKQLGGMGMTINMGRPAGKVIGYITLGGTVLLIAFVVWIMTLDFTVKVAEDVVIDVPMYGTRFSREDVESIEWSDTQLNGTRTNGYGGQEKGFGFFTLDGYGRVLLYNYAAVDEHIDIRLKEGATREWVIINLDTLQETEDLYQELLAWQKGE